MNEAKNRAAIAIVATLLAAAAGGACAQSLPLERIKLPDGFSIELVARVPSARAMAWGERGTLFVGSRDSRVYAVTLPPSARGEATVRTIASGLSSPIGVAFHGGALYVGAVDRIVRLDDIERHLDEPGEPVLVTKALPSDRHHGGKYLAFGPDGKLYVNIGMPCNVCERDPDRYGVIVRMNRDGSAIEPFARGIRNSVGFDWHPQTKELWLTDNGRDHLGDDAPPDTLKRAPRAGLNFGFPYCHAGTISDPEFGSKHACSEFTPPAQALGPHVAALGMRFYTGAQFPQAYRNQIFIAEHGSWNRSRKIGYRVTLVTLGADGRASGHPSANGV